jgi:RimJ/RimL family protein N-acetyltransferase
VVGTISKTRAMRISYQGQTETFMNLEKESIFGVKKKNKAEVEAKKIEVKELLETDAPEIEALLQKVWSTANEYPKEWRKKRILSKKHILKEMQKGHHYFGIRIDNKLGGVYKALITDNGLLGEHQTVDPDYRGLGLATAMYHQFIGFAKQNNCKKVYVNILANQIPSKKTLEKMGFHTKGQEYEQAKGMKVQMYVKDI